MILFLRRFDILTHPEWLPSLGVTPIDVKIIFTVTALPRDGTGMREYHSDGIFGELPALPATTAPLSPSLSKGSITTNNEESSGKP